MRRGMLRAMKSHRCPLTVILVLAFAAPLTGCSRLAPPGQQSSRTVAILTAECDQGKYVRCFSLGTKFASGDGVAKDNSRAVVLLQRACEGGNAQGCSGLGFMYETGRGLAQDTARAVTLYRRACDSGDGLGCAFLGTM